TVTHAQALDVALCWGWIDGLRKSFDAESFIQRFSPRRAGSLWSQINRDHVARLARAGRIQPPGQQQIDAAKANGRCAKDVSDARKSKSPPVGVAHQQDEDARGPRPKDRGACDAARAR
ncbi:MAG TPA: hypothetical protein VM115_10725, partial [Vicinamibacterales bacterium]|nr:hypothetical protein [Vicinamibacterales bacterium]